MGCPETIEKTIELGTAIRRVEGDGHTFRIERVYVTSQGDYPNEYCLGGTLFHKDTEASMPMLTTRLPRTVVERALKLGKREGKPNKLSSEK